MELGDIYTADRHEAGAEMQCTLPDGMPLDCFITLVGVDSHKWRDIKKRNREKMIKGEPVDQAEMLAEASIGWRGFTRDGETVEFSRDEVLKLYRNAPYLCDQADTFIAERANFSKA